MWNIAPYVQSVSEKNKKYKFLSFELLKLHQSSSESIISKTIT